jgi:hypothetical protein
MEIPSNNLIAEILSQIESHGKVKGLPFTRELLFSSPLNQWVADIRVRNRLTLVLTFSQEVSPTAIPSTVFFVATKRCMYGGTELLLGPSTPERLAEQCYGVGKEISGSNP